jgi:fucose permease
MLLVLHPAFALTGVLQAVNGPLMPSLAATFHWGDSQSGTLFLLYFLGSSTAPLFCRFNYSRTMAMGFLTMALACGCIALAQPLLLDPLFLLLGLSNGIGSSTVSLLVGRNYRENCAPTLTLLNFTWSAGALLAPLLAAPLLVAHSYRAVYLLVAVLSLLMALACATRLKDGPEAAPPNGSSAGRGRVLLIALCAAIGFLEVGVENVSVAWMSTYLQRTAASGLALAAAATSLYWIGFLAARALASVLLWRVAAMRVFYGSLGLALAASLVLVAAPHRWSCGPAVLLLLGAALGPVYPLLLSTLFSRVQRTEDSRWMLAIAGLGGSMLPWLTGAISAHSGSLRVGLLTIPAAVAMMALLFSLLPGKPKEA